MSIYRSLGPLAVAATLATVPRVARADEGEKVFASSCTGCHNVKSRPLDAIRLDRKKWSEQIERMEGLGAEIPGGNKRAELLDYLVRTHGPDTPAPEPKK